MTERDIVRTLVSGLLMALVSFIVLSVAPVRAADLAAGATVFNTNCAACHIGGGNVVNGAKTLKADALAQFGMNSLEAIQNQVTKGKAAMPAFKGRLTPEEIANVAAYVLDQSEKGW